MISLPTWLSTCRWRAPAPRADGDRLLVTCHSAKYLDGPHQVPAEYCRDCVFPDHLAPPPLPRALQCIHLGEPLPRPDETGFCCALHAECVVDPMSRDPRRNCQTCGDYLERDPLGPDAEQMLHRAESFLDALPEYPSDRYHGRGVVIAGGGERYFASLYVTVRALRHVGCSLPIEIWFFGDRGEMSAAHRAWLAPFGVEFVDADEIRRRHGTREFGGWELKVFATLHSRFEELLFLDADCYPCRNPEFLFDEADYRARGAIFWPDMETIDRRLKWAAFRVDDPHRPGSVESGQYVLDKRQTWRALNLTWFYNDHSDYYYRYCYGDKHTFEVAWTRCGPPFVMWNAQAHWAGVAYIHPGPDSAPLFIHRCADKFRLGGQSYITNQNHARPTFHSHLPLEDHCWKWFRELDGN